MEMSGTLKEANQKMSLAVEHFKQELSKLRTGRAHPGMLDGVMVEAYGQSMPLISVAGITVPEATLIQISPFDPANLQPIADAIRNNESLDLNPVDDGRVIRIQIPPLTTESRQQMVKVLHQKAEEAAVSLRNARHEAIKAGEQAERDKSIGKDDRFKFEKQIDDDLAKRKAEIDQLAEAKEQEIMTI